MFFVFFLFNLGRRSVNLSPAIQVLQKACILRVLPSKRSLYSRRESLLSRRSCLSISSLILRASLASGLRQQAPTELRVITPGLTLPLPRHRHIHNVCYAEGKSPPEYPKKKKIYLFLINPLRNPLCVRKHSGSPELERSF